MKEVSKRFNETEAEIQAIKMNNSTLELNQTELNSSEKYSNGTEIEENRPILGILERNDTAENSGMRKILYLLDFDVRKYRLIHGK